MECRREAEVRAAVRVRGWHAACHEELKRHIEQCEICGDLAALVELMREDHDLMLREHRLPSAGQVWWRAAVRARADASRAAVRPLTWVHGIAAACVVGLGVASLGFAWPAVARALEWAGSLTSHVDPTGTMVAEVVATARTRIPFVLAVAACVILASVALYFALRDEEGG